MKERFYVDGDRCTFPTYKGTDGLPLRGVVTSSTQMESGELDIHWENLSGPGGTTCSYNQWSRESFRLINKSKPTIVILLND